MSDKVSYSQIEEVNALLLKGEPGNITVDEHSGYTGYKPQAVVDAMNKVLWGDWGFTELSSEIVPGEKGGLAIAQVEVWLSGHTFRPPSYGQNRVTRGDVGDAKKGAQTDAIKKALSYFSVGNRAYHGQLENPNKPQQSRQASKNEIRQVQQSTSNQEQSKPLSNKERLNKLYDKASALGKFTKGTDAKQNASAFLKWAGEVLGAKIANAEQITASRLDIIEKYLESAEAA